jgi:hypothetical protein
VNDEVEGFRRKQSLPNFKVLGYPGILLLGLRQTPKTSVRIVGQPAEI